MDALVEIGKLAAAFLLGLTSHIGACTQPAVDYKGPSDAPETPRSLEIAIPLRVGLNPPECPPGG